MRKSKNDGNRTDSETEFQPMMCDGPFIVERDGEKETVWRLPDTEIEIPQNLCGIVYPLSGVNVDPSNPRKTKNLDALVASIRRFGIRKPIVVNENTMEIEAGHQTRAALKQLGVNCAPMVFVKDNDMRAAAFNIADNRTAEIVADWDEDALAKIYATLRENDALEGTGFDDEGLLDVFNRLKTEEIESDKMDGTQTTTMSTMSDHSDRQREWRVIVHCENEEHQSEVCTMLEEKGLRVTLNVI